MSLKQSDIQAVSGALHELYANTDANTLPQCIVRLLHRLISADSAVYNSFDFRTGEMQVIHDHGPDGDRYLPALQRHVEQHPLMVHIRSHWREGAACLSDVISQRQLRDEPIYCEFLHPLGIEKQLGLVVEDRTYGVTAVGLQRQGRNFSSRDKAVLTLLQPHLMQAYKNASDITRASSLIWNTAQALHLTQIGVVRLAPRLKIDWISHRAKQWLIAYFPEGQARIEDAKLPLKLEAWARQQLDKKKISRFPVQESCQFVIERGTLFIRWLHGDNGRSHLILSERTAAASPGELESLGLSRREAEVLHWIAQGKTNEFISITLSTSKRTVDKHVENILRKLGAQSRVEAALLAERHRRLS